MEKIKEFFKRIGPGLITGAADDDPSGIATYSIAGAAFGFSMLWPAIFTLPFMAAVQETCARIGLVTRKGLAGAMKGRVWAPVAVGISLLLFLANVFNIGADISAMVAVVNLLVSTNEILVGLIFTVVLVVLMIFLPYKKIAAVFKWLTLFLLAYVLTFFIANGNNLFTVLIKAFTLNIDLFTNKNYILTLLAVLGTTISPYLFFWQASEEAEEEKINHRIVTKNELKTEKDDTIFGMLFSNAITFFIIATCASTLFRAGITDIQTASQAALALKPLAGDFAFLLFALGIIGAGILAIPILAGSAAYALSETFGFSEGLNKRFNQAKVFYFVIILATALGFLLNFIGISSMKFLFWSAVINGMVAPVMIGIILYLANQKSLMGEYKNGFWANLLVGTTLIFMTLTALAVLL